MAALRFTSTAAMPPKMRDMLQAQRPAKKRKPAPPMLPSAPKRRPSRDLEHNEQVVFFNRIRTLALNNPTYAVAASRTFAIPNGGGRSKREAGRLKAEGVKAGVSDIFCSVARGGMHGLYIEMKSLTGSPSREQTAWINESREQGYCAEVCKGADAAFAIWKAYIDG